MMALLLAVLLGLQTKVGWNHPGTKVEYFRLCIDGQCWRVTKAAAKTATPTWWEVPIPRSVDMRLSHQWTVQACSRSGCSPAAALPPARRPKGPQS
jgi:hypothetical protein